MSMLQRAVRCASCLLLCTMATVLSPMASAQDVTVDFDAVVGPVKQMNCVNNPPTNADFEAYKALKIPYMRTHDTAQTSQGTYGGANAIDISGIFPDFSKNVNDPESYRFEETDAVLKRTLDAGTRIFYRLGQSIENGDNPTRRHVFPPEDNKKWARICEHIVRHYNEGWKNGYHWNIEYWEIWNEPELDQPERWRTYPQMWGGTVEQFCDLYGTVAKHLKKCFPSIKVGGCAFSSMTSKNSRPFVESFLKYISDNNVPFDFVSYHRYSTTIEKMAKTIEGNNVLLEQFGYGDTESWLNEWNIMDFKTEGNYYINARKSIKGAAYAVAVMNTCQYLKVDKLMYYDFRPTTSYNGVFEPYTAEPLPAYYAFYAWRKLADLGTAVKVSSAKSDIFASAAVGEDGRRGILVSRFNSDDNVHSPKVVSIKAGGLDSSVNVVFGHLTDDNRRFTEIPLAVENGIISVRMTPQSFVYVEYK